jgi:GT2 family glycosyltransferase
MSPLEHYLAEGRNQLLSPHPLFDPHWYVDQCIEFEDKTLYDLEHYVVFGSRIGRSPSPMFWPNLYRLLHREVKAREIEPLYHYLRWGGERSLQGSPFLDANFYSAQIPGVEDQVEFEPLSHFVDSGHDAHLRTSADERSEKFAHWLVDRRDLIRNRVQTTDGVRTPFCDWRERAKAICLNGDPAPRISVIIPTFNRSQDVVRCIESIARSGDDTAMEVILVDDGSLDAHQEIFRLIKGIRMVTLDENRGFAHAIENGVSVSSAEYLMFLNNDTEVLPDSVDALVEVLDRRETVGAVGSLILHSDLTVQEVGGLVWSDGTASHIARGLSPLEPCTRRPRTVDYCSAAALAVRRQLWDTIGGFDPRFAPAYYEDTDLCFSVARRGFEVLVNPESVVVHKESASYGRDPSGQSARQEMNRPKFASKWKSVLSKKPEPPRPEPDWRAWDDCFGDKSFMVT